MAEIKIEKRKPIWPWIVVVVLIVAVVYYIYVRDENTNRDNTVEVENTTSVDTIN